jgi:hypothetical protein
LVYVFPSPDDLGLGEVPLCAPKFASRYRYAIERLEDWDVEFVADRGFGHFGNFMAIY